jgi:hypothetical protein
LHYFFECQVPHISCAPCHALDLQKNVIAFHSPTLAQKIVP